MFQPELSVNDSPWLDHVMIIEALRAPWRDPEGWRRLRTYAAEADRVRATSLASDLYSWADEREQDARLFSA